jgi:nucleoid DNA-binding protein
MPKYAEADMHISDMIIFRDWYREALRISHDDSIPIAAKQQRSDQLYNDLPENVQRFIKSNGLIGRMYDDIPNLCDSKSAKKYTAFEFTNLPSNTMFIETLLTTQSFLRSYCSEIGQDDPTEQQLENIEMSADTVPPHVREEIISQFLDESLGSYKTTPEAVYIRNKAKMNGDNPTFVPYLDLLTKSEFASCGKALSSLTNYRNRHLEAIRMLSRELTDAANTSEVAIRSFGTFKSEEAAHRFIKNNAKNIRTYAYVAPVGKISFIDSFKDIRSRTRIAAKYDPTVLAAIQDSGSMTLAEADKLIDRVTDAKRKNDSVQITSEEQEQFETMIKGRSDPEKNAAYHKLIGNNSVDNFTGTNASVTSLADGSISNVTL